MILCSSNEIKIKEFKQILGDLIEIEEGKDLEEVMGTSEEVILYKSILCGKGYVVEDTILEINGIEVVDIRSKVEDLKEGDKAVWITSLGYNNGEEIIIYRGIQEGIITRLRGDEGFDFDPYFIPKELFGTEDVGKIDIRNNTLSELNSKGMKTIYSARAKALTNLIKDDRFLIESIENIPKWSGKYQIHH